MSQDRMPTPQVGDFAPDAVLPDGSPLAGLRGKPVVLAFAPDEWNPAYAYQSEIFARLAQEFGDQAAFVDAATDDWHSLDCRGELANQFGVAERRALVLIDEHGVVRWRIMVEPGRDIQSGEVLAALESLKTPTVSPGSAPVVGGLSRRAFVTATLAAAALLVLPGQDATAAPNLPEFTDVQLTDNQTVGDLIPVSLKINGETYRLTIEPRVALLDAMRENLHLTGTKKGCDHGQCGACTVHIDGQSALSCLMLAVMSQGKAITTIEGLGTPERLHPVQTAFIKHDAYQCGYCTPGQIMAATALLRDKRTRSAVEIREAMSGNLCRCAAYPNIIAAIQDAQTV